MAGILRSLMNALLSIGILEVEVEVLILVPSIEIKAIKPLIHSPTYVKPYL